MSLSAARQVNLSHLKIKTRLFVDQGLHRSPKIIYPEFDKNLMKNQSVLPIFFKFNSVARVEFPKSFIFLKSICFEWARRFLRPLLFILVFMFVFALLLLFILLLVLVILVAKMHNTINCIVILKVLLSITHFHTQLQRSLNYLRKFIKWISDRN